MTHLLSDLRAAIGDAHVLTDPADLSPYAADWRGAYRGTPLAVVRPASTSEVAEVVRLAHAAGVAIVPQGGNTGMCGGAIPSGDGSQLVLSLGRLRQVREVDAAGGTITVEAGVILADVQAAAQAVDRLFPLSLGAEGSCTVGGNIATNAGGTAVLRYGMMRSLVLGLEVVLPDGRVWDGLRSLRKDNTGYDLTQLFIGAEGTLGIVTAAVLTLHPATPARATAWVALPSVAAAATLLPLLREYAAERLTTWELVSRPALELVLAAGLADPLASDAEWFGLIEIAGPAGASVDDDLERALAAAVEAGLVLDAAVAGSPAQRSGLWALRERVSEAQESLGPTIKHDVSVPITSLDDLVARLGPALESALPGIRPIVYGHVGDGNLHYNLSRPASLSGDHFVAQAAMLSTIVHDCTVELGGSISAEHGLGSGKAAAAAAYKSDVEVDLMRAVKNALDPAGLMNPGKVLAPD
ncbi:FAD linked oxidase domain-containing protein [Nocardioides sp. CF8]|uniref:FAD-binding oxidoreductase n=1 Tax=Nocardioides sp. CF8 TaxID=110319 RepID=UPI000330F9D1|nr:FAD-binding oxidoreductase [Nocardioides sp. CF8]EON22612.1 FAD linked oxidase domain-containing protein [Nocardioides sp. CF8]